METNKTIEESIIAALDCTDTNLLKYIPYILQDFWELGTPSEEIIKIIKKYKRDYSNLHVLDLGSGKGAVSVKIASELKCRCFGIDAMDDFVNFSIQKAGEFSVSNICTFEKNDIRTRIETLGKYDIIVLGAIGPVFGDYYTTLVQLTPHLSRDGLIIINDAYVEDACDEIFPGVLRKSELIKQVNNAGMEFVEEITKDDIPSLDEEFEKQFKDLQRRCMELIEKYPNDKDLFLGYVEKEKEEYGLLSNEIIPAILVLKQKAANLQ